jgi:hypothetical protein
MAIRPIREPRAPLGSVLMRPIEWAHSGSLRLLEWFNQERWTLTLTLLALVLANSFLLYLFLQGQDTRALAFVIILFVIVLSWLVPELSIAVLIVGGTGLYINLLFYTTGGAFGTGSRPILLALLLVVSFRAIYEYLRTPPAERPKVFTWLTILLALFWVYYMAHVMYINVFRYNIPPPDNALMVLGFERRGLIRYFDAHVLWIGVIPMIILLRNYGRAKRVLFLVGLAAFSGGVGTFLEYLAPLPEFWKVAFMIRVAGQSEEGYRVAAPAPIHLVVLLMWYVLYRVGYLKWWQNSLALFYLMATALAVAAMKTRMLWGAILLFLPFALLLKPPKAQLRQFVVFGFAGLLAASLTLHPQIYDLTTQIAREANQRWQRNYAFGGDPRNDPSYQARVREREVWELHYATLSITDKLFGRGLEEGYGLYVSLKDLGYNPMYDQVYVEKTRLHFSWLGRLLHIGVLGSGLLALVLVAAILRAVQALVVIPQPSVKALAFASLASTTGMIPYDAIQFFTLAENSVLPIIFSWAIVEAALHWHRTGQLPDEADG